MPPKISIGACRRAIEIAGGSLPLMIRGEPVPITRTLRTQGTHWVCGAIQLPRASQEALTRQARGIIAEDERPLIPPAPPTISIRECQHAIERGGGISITLRGARCASPRSPPGMSAGGLAARSSLRPKRRHSSPSAREPSWRTPGLGAKNPRPGRVKTPRGDRRTHRPGARPGETGRAG